MARSTGSHALSVGWGDFVRVKTLLAFAGIHRLRKKQALRIMEGLFL